MDMDDVDDRDIMEIKDDLCPQSHDYKYDDHNDTNIN
eukprot:CAMPEP_0201587804 /NCGR_PEP_ID=MMETSP0190_2-20130828/147707_1 /ASSEMBLY_ACC=CAM_ASM_000263 /TAXON_ID=37353 /ORGANISM="Rosalina sp." /LENGTH=36 /DNA_ID= /DNA_START= /DNA_END= /DNA_ORIENTATION=